MRTHTYYDAVIIPEILEANSMETMENVHCHDHSTFVSRALQLVETHSH